MDETNLDRRTEEIGRDIFARARQNGAVDGVWFERLAMDWGMRDESVKAQLLRFMDVLPALRTPRQINHHVREYLDSVRERLPRLIGRIIGAWPDEGFIGRCAAAIALASTRRMARRFIAATNLPQAIATIHALRRRKLAFTIDLLGEAVLSEAEANKYQEEYLHLVAGLSADEKSWPYIEQIDADAQSRLPRVNVSVKLSSLFSQFDPIDPEGTSRAVCQRLRPILRLAMKTGVFINIDMEQYAFKNTTLRIFRQVLEEPEFAAWPNVGIAMQAYLRETGDDLADLAAWARRRGTAVWVRLVKGAYWDYQTVISAQNDWPLPVWSHKPETDANFELLTTFLLENADVLRPAIASHNIRSIAHAMAMAEKLNLPPASVEFQMLYGMAGEIMAALVDMGRRVRVYTPYGQLLPGMAYLVRRLLENTSNQSFLRAGFTENLPEEQLLMNPLKLLREKQHSPSPSTLGEGGGEGSHQNREREGKNPHPNPLSDYREREIGEGFVNEPLTDFADETARETMSAALRDVSKRFGQSYPPVIAGKKQDCDQWIESLNPSHIKQIVGRAGSATIKQANEAVAAARETFPAWRSLPAQRRAEYLVKSAAILRRRRFELAAWEVHETGKPWREADADVAEAIDYCEFYAREMIRLAVPHRRDVPGEDNEYIYEARGVAVAIAPWNFPLAILCGMTTAALAAGNTAVMKPAEQSPVIAALLMEVFAEAGFPPGVVNYLPGVGEEIGPVLVNHPDVALIAFTGSRAVGLSIQEQAAQTPAGQENIKRVITEMGGKNAVIIDQDADLDEAVLGVAASAFGYAGQKCSACSRAIVLAEVYDLFLARLIETTRSLKIAPAEEPGCFVGPVIDDDAKQRILAAIERGKGEARLVYAGEIGELQQEGYFVGPHIFAEVDPQTTLAQEEIFGPVLAVMKARDLDEALALASGTRYALTGGLFSRSPANIQRIRREFRVGNLYVNRKITGALVDRQPFGGIKLSGVGSKAGGPDYLLQFMWGRTITENTLRRGFAPGEMGENSDIFNKL